MNPSIFKLIAIAITALVIFVTATSRSPSEETQIAVLYDQTDTTLIQDIDQMASSIASHAGIDTIDGKWGAVRVTLSIIGETSTQDILSVYLAPSESYWFRNEMEHKDRGRKFFKELKSALIKVTRPGNGMSKSFVNRNTHYHLSSLAQKKGKRFCIIYSNLIENGPKVRFYDYRDNPEEIIVKQDSLMEVLSKDYPLADLSGIRIIGIHKETTLIDDELHEVGKRFYKSYWQRNGASVEYTGHSTLSSIHR